MLETCEKPPQSYEEQLFESYVAALLVETRQRIEEAIRQEALDENAPLAIEEIKTMVNEKLKSLFDEICKTCLQNFGENKMTFGEIPSFARTVKVYVLALRKRVLSVDDIPEDIKTITYAIALVKGVLKVGDIPETHRLTELFLKAVEMGFFMKDVPEQMRTPEMYEAAVKKDLPVNRVPPDMRTEGVAEIVSKEAETRPPAWKRK